MTVDDDPWPVPGRITWALDMPMAEGAVGPLEGPGVDEFCGVQEPTVDLWETGEVIPSDEELARLAELTGYPVEWFYRPMLDLSGAFACVSSGPRHGCYRFDDPQLDKALALADLGEPDQVSRVARPRTRGATSTTSTTSTTVRPRRPTVQITTQAPAECTGCGDPMRRQVWADNGGRCSACRP